MYIIYSGSAAFAIYNEQWIKMYFFSGCVGQKSNVFLFKEKLLDKAIKILKNQKINIEPSAAAGLALFLEMKNKIPINKKKN